jgi:hypothetical protein
MGGAHSVASMTTKNETQPKRAVLLQKKSKLCGMWHIMMQYGSLIIEAISHLHRPRKFYQSSIFHRNRKSGFFLVTLFIQSLCIISA